MSYKKLSPNTYYARLKRDPFCLNFTENRVTMALAKTTDSAEPAQMQAANMNMPEHCAKQNRVLLQCLMANQDAVKNYLIKAVGQRADAEDLFQKLLVKAMNTSFHEHLDNPLAYGYRMAQHLVIDHHREQQRAPAELEHEPQCEAVSLETMLDNQQRVALYKQVLSEMSPLRRDIFIRRRLHNESRQHIATTLGLNEETVKKHITRAMDALKIAIEARFSDKPRPRSGI